MGSNWESMKIKIFTCPECRYRKFETLGNLNVHIGKSHCIDYKIIGVKNGRPLIIKKGPRMTFEYVENTPNHE